MRKEKAQKEIMNPASAVSFTGSQTRREFLAGAGLGVLGAAAMLPAAAWTLAARAPQEAARPAIIDVHHHFAPPAWREEIIKRNMGNPLILGWKPEVSLAEMDKLGVTVSMLSMTRPGIWFGDVAVARRLARDANEYGAHLVTQYPKRFGLFAALPLPDVDGSLKEIEYAFDTLKADGVAMMSTFDDIYLGDPKLAPVMDELNRRKAVVLEHPVREDRQNPLNGVELINETTKTIHSLLYNGTVVRCPDIRFIFAHGGGTLPMSAGRFAIPQNKLPKGLMFELQKFYYDCAAITTSYQLPLVKALVPLPHFLFGTDFPFAGPGGLAAVDKGLRDNGGFSESELRSIEHGNILELIPRLKTT